MNRVVLTTAEGLDEAAKNASIIVLHITRREVEAGLVGDIVDRLMCLSDRADYTAQFSNRVMLSVDGYNNDPRELSEIPEVVSLFRSIDAQWPYWFHFMALEDRSLDTVFMILLGSKRTADRTSEGQVIHSFEEDRFRATFLSKIKAMNALHDLHEIKLETAIEVSDRALGRINAILT